jgi:thiol-disulfide isomerase/thioredoxin
MEVITVDISEQHQDGVLIFAKHECETCQMVAPVFGQIAGKLPTVIYTQDDPAFPSNVGAVDDTSLESSFAFDVEAVPTLVRMKGGKEIARTYGWNREDWEKLTGLKGLGEGLPTMRPGCGSKSREPGVYDALRAKYGKLDFKSRRRDRSLLRSRLERWAAGGSPDRRSHPAHA